MNNYLYYIAIKKYKMLFVFIIFLKKYRDYRYLISFENTLLLKKLQNLL